MVALLITIAVLCMPLAPASAAKLIFGTDEHLRKIADIDLKGPNGESLYLGYKVTLHAFGLPYRITDDGYILGVVGESRRYYPLNAGLIASLQSQGGCRDPCRPTTYRPSTT